MDKKEGKKKKLFRRLISPYRMVIINEETFEERLQFRVSKLSLLLISVFSFVLLGSLFFSSIAFTPLKEFIPGYDSSELRKKAVQNLFVTDSLITLYNQNIQYLNAVKAVLNEEVRFQDPEFSADALSGEDPEPPTFLSSIPEDSLLRAFVTQQDKYNPNLDGVTYQTTIAWSHPIQIAKLPLVFDGFVDWALEEGDNKSKSVSNLHAQPALVADISALWDKPNLLMLGMEYLYWKNKFGIEGLDENIPQLLIRSIFLNKKGSPTPGAFC